TTSDPITVQPGPAAQLQVLLPGQTANPGKPPYDKGQNGGYTGSLSPFTAGTGFSVTVNVVDAYFNQTLTDTFVTLTSNDPFADLSAYANKKTGTAGNYTGEFIFSGVAMITRTANPATGWQIFASTATGDPYSQGISTWVVVQAGMAQKLLVLVPPGESLVEGNPSGKSGSPAGPFTVGTTYFVQVLAVDSHFNIVPTTNPVTTLTSDDPNAVSPSTDSPKTMTNGAVSLPFMLKTGEVYPNGTRTTFLTASAAGFATGAPYQSGGLVMAPTTYSTIQILVPPQQGAPGTATGKTAVTIT